MSQSLDDVPRIVIFPPIIPLGTIMVAVILQWLCPLGFPAQLTSTCRILVGSIVFAAGLALLLAGAYELSRNGTHVKPSLPTLKLVTSGVYAWTRNPFYVGGSAALLGGALATGLDWMPILYVASFILLHYGVVLPEENYLQRKFDDDYRQYKASVPRYFGIF